MSNSPTLVFVPGSWHKPSCYDKIIKLLRDEHNVKCVPVTLPSTQDNPNATFKDDIDAARSVIISETSQGHNVIVIAHSYGGMVGNSAIKGLTRPKNISIKRESSTSQTTTSPPQAQDTTESDHGHGHGHVAALILIASGYTLTGFAFMDPFLGCPPPSWRIDKKTGYAVLVANTHDFFYHDLPDDEATYHVSQLTTQSLKALFEGREHAYAGWQDVPNWYIGTLEDRGLPVAMQRMTVEMARGQGAVVYHTELRSGHSPFLSMPGEVVEVVMEAVEVVSRPRAQAQLQAEAVKMSTSTSSSDKVFRNPAFRLTAPSTWLGYGIPLVMGRVLGWTFAGFMGLRRLWKGKK